jgi:predicted TIM-barrel fold metal-dependent hydrolase
MKFIDIDTHYFPGIDVYKKLPEPYRSLAPQLNWKYYTKKPKFWDKTYGQGTETVRDSAFDTEVSQYSWKKPLLCDDNGFHDIDIFPGGKSKYLCSVKNGLDKGAIYDKENGGPFRGDIFYSEKESQDLESRKKVLDRLGIEKNILKIYNYTLGLNYRIDGDLALNLAKAYNDNVINVCKNQNRFWPVVWLPMQNKNSSTELLKLMDNYLENGAVGLNIGNHFTYAEHTFGLAWGLCDWMEPYWAHANEYQYPIFCHILDDFYDSRYWWKFNTQEHLEKHYNDNKNLLPLIYPGDKGLNSHEISFASFITEGVLDRYPNLRLVFCETGINWVMPTIEKISKYLNRDCKHYLKNWSFTIEPEAKNFEIDANNIGFDHLLFATDYPHMDAGGRNRENDVKNVLNLNTGELNKNKISSINAYKLFNKTSFC